MLFSSTAKHLLSIYCVPGSAPQASHALFHQFSQEPHAANVIIPILKMMNQGSEQLNNLSRVTQLLTGKPKQPNSSASFLNLCTLYCLSPKECSSLNLPFQWLLSVS